MSDFQNGHKETNIELEILSIDTKLNKHGLISIEVVPEPPFVMPNPKSGKAVLQISATNLDRIARACGAERLELLASSIKLNPNDPSYLVIGATYCKQGEKIGKKEDGSDIISKAGHTTFQKTFWNTEIDTIILGDSSAEQVKDILKDVQKDILKEAMQNNRVGYAEARRKRLQGGSGGVQAETGNAEDNTPVSADDQEEEVI